MVGLTVAGGRPAAVVHVPLDPGSRGRRASRATPCWSPSPDARGRRHAAADDRDRVPRDGLGGRGPRAASTASTSTGWDHFLPRSRRTSPGCRHEPEPIDETLVGDRGPDPAPACSTCSSPTVGAPRPSLATRLPVTRQAVAKHLGVLERVGLVHGTAAGREKRYRVDDAQLAKAAAQLDVGRLGLGRPPATHQEDRRVHRERTRRRRTMADILHRIGVLTETPEKVYDALTTRRRSRRLVDHRHDGGCRVRAASSSSGSRRSAASTWRCVEAVPGKKVTWRVADGPEEWIGHHDRLGAPPGRRLHDRAVQARGLARAGRVHAPLQHQVGPVPDEPQVAGGDRRRAARRRATWRSATGTEAGDGAGGMPG